MRTPTSLSRTKFVCGSIFSFCVLLATTGRSKADILLKVDSTKPWQGYMNVFNTPDYSGGYQFGSAWGLGALTAYFSGTNSLTLIPNTNTYNPADAYWVNGDGSGNKFMEANFYIENLALRGQTVTFSGTIISNNLTAGHLTRVFVKTLDSSAGYSVVPGASQFVDVANSATPVDFSITVAIPDGGNFIPQYGFVTTGTNVNPALIDSYGLVRIAVDNTDPSIQGQPQSQRVQVGSTASFTVNAIGGSTLSYQWKRYGTNLLNGGNISGATSATLVVSNAQFGDATTYTVVVTDTAGSLESDPATLRVKTAAEFSNALDNPGFEDGVYNPWYAFAGSALKSTNDFYANDPGYPVQTYDGTNCSASYVAGEWNGLFQDVPASPGQIFTADTWFYLPSMEMFFGDISAWLEVQFRTSGDAPLALYKSYIAAPGFPLDTWVNLPATNGFAGDFVTPIPNARYLVAPAGTAKVRYQVTVHALAGGFGSIYYDTSKLMIKIPTSLKASIAGGNVTISWTSQGSTSYQVVYKDDLTGSWTPTGAPVAGDGGVKSASFAISPGNRFYSVITQ